MGGTLSLNGTWSLAWAEGSPLVPPRHLTAEVVQGWRMLPARVPAPIHQVLVEQGLLEDPNVGLNSLRARWVEEMFWIYRRSFDVPAGATGQRAWLVFERLELETVVLLNGEEVGRHANAHRPARFDVTGRLREGANTLVVRCDTGLHAAADKPAADYGAREIQALTHRHWHRHPQYQSGWDWSPRLVNVGLLGDVRLEWQAGPRLSEVAVFAVPADDYASATVQVRAGIDHAGDQPATVTLRARVVETGQEVCQEVTAPAGETRHELRLELDQPRLWWPLGQGAQDRYTIEVSLLAGDETTTVTRRTGVRRIELDQSPHPVEGRYCTLRVNGRPVFCKGGNFVPPDLLYSTVDAARYRELVDLAVAANFTMLRIWGGGLFADHALCEACDEAGLLIWHDFLFACSKYPGDDPAFAAEVRREVTWAVRDLAHHPSLVVWCGNNEIEWGDWAWGYDRSGRTHPHYALFHHDFPQIVAAEDASTLYWISSPWSPDFGFPNDPTRGDQHPWDVSLGLPGGADFWRYRRNVDRFPNEGGVLGASSPATLRQGLGETDLVFRSPAWEHHDNPFANTDHRPGSPGHAYATVELWLGLDPPALDPETYAFASALLQAEGLVEYISNYRRRMYSSASAIFWMYNDSWPVTHGWTIIDYYRRRKLAYHPVRRAFQPLGVVLADEGDEVVAYGVNDTPEPWSGELRWGLFALAGGRPVDQTLAVTLAANAATRLASLPRSTWDGLGTTTHGAFGLLLRDGAQVAAHRLFVERFGDLALAAPTIQVARQGETVTLASDVFVWGACLDLDGERPLADNVVDLLPGVPYTLPWPAACGEPTVLRCGNDLVLDR